MLYLVDASVYIFRAYFSLPDTFRDKDDQPAQAVYGFARFLVELLRRERPVHIACAFDESLTTSFRNELYPPYKANRELQPEELEQQLLACRRIAEGLGIACFSSDRFEADDLIGTLATLHRSDATPVTIVTRDKDLGQLIQPRDVLWDYAGDIRLDVAGVQKKMGVAPAVIPDLLGLMGDSVDNIPGVRGVGQKTAVALLQHFRDMEDLYAGLERVGQLKFRGAKTLAPKLEADRDNAFMSRELATIKCDIELQCTLESLQWHGPDEAMLREFLGDFDFGTRMLKQAMTLR